MLYEVITVEAFPGDGLDVERLVEFVRQGVELSAHVGGLVHLEQLDPGLYRLFGVAANEVCERFRSALYPTEGHHDVGQLDCRFVLFDQFFFLDSYNFV